MKLKPKSITTFCHLFSKFVRCRYIHEYPAHANTIDNQSQQILSDNYYQL